MKIVNLLKMMIVTAMTTVAVAVAITTAVIATAITIVMKMMMLIHIYKYLTAPQFNMSPQQTNVMQAYHSTRMPVLVAEFVSR